MKKFSLILITSLLVFLICGCGNAATPEKETETETEKQCSHNWQGATCISAPICTLCGVTPDGGQALGHTWIDATCETPKTCSVCGSTEGQAIGHMWNLDAPTCSESKFCTVCDKIEGEALNHPNKSEATCTEPEKCTICLETFGEPLGHKLTDATCTSAKMCSVCNAKEGDALGHDYQKNVCTRCSDKLIEDLSDLRDYLRKNHSSLKTAIGDINYLSISITEEDPNWGTHDFNILIWSNLKCSSLNATFDHTILLGDFLPYEDRVQALVDILKYEESIVKIAEEAFPDKKFQVKFFDEGYRYPSIKVDYYNTSKLVWCNWERNNSGLNGYLSTDKTEFKILMWDFMSGYSSSSNNKINQILADAKKSFPNYTIERYLRVY